MRFFLPCTAADLRQRRLPKRRSVLVEERADKTKEQMEIRFENALEEAAFESLVFLFSGDDAPCRIVASGETTEGENPTGWDQVESLHVDGLTVEPLIVKARQAQTQEDLDDLTVEITATPLEWFDVSELAALNHRFGG